MFPFITLLRGKHRGGASSSPFNSWMLPCLSSLCCLLVVYSSTLAILVNPGVESSLFALARLLLTFTGSTFRLTRHHTHSLTTEYGLRSTPYSVQSTL